MALEAQPERACDRRLPRHRQPVQLVMEAEREAGHQHASADFDLAQVADEVRGREGVVEEPWRQGGTVDLDRGDVEHTARVAAFAPERAPVGVERNAVQRHGRDVVGIHVQLHGERIGPVVARRVDHDVAAGDDEQPLVAGEEEPGGVAEGALVAPREDADDRNEQGFDHGMPAS